jgi:hypothetical protein
MTQFHRQLNHLTARLLDALNFPSLSADAWAARNVTNAVWRGHQSAAA